jgi:hypothetical protein
MQRFETLNATNCNAVLLVSFSTQHRFEQIKLYHANRWENLAYHSHHHSHFFTGGNNYLACIQLPDT